MREEGEKKLLKKVTKMKLSLIVIVVLLITTPTVFSAESTEFQAYKPLQKEQPAYVEGELLVKFSNEGLSEASLKQKGIKIKEMITDNVAVIEIPQYNKTKNLVSTLESVEGILEVQPNYIYYPTEISNDPFTEYLWGLNNSGQKILNSMGKKDMDINIPEAWKLTENRELKEVVVAVIDTGIQIDHPDLRENIWVNELEANGLPGVDDDKNGYIDDINGFDFYFNDGSVFDSYDDDDHGTHVAGTIAASTNNNLGIAGIAPNVKIMPLKFLGPYGGYSSDAIRAIEYAKNKGVKISNNSWGSNNYDSFLESAIKESNMLFVAAAGNDGVNNDYIPHYPSDYKSSNIISVAALNNQGNLASFSNYGTKNVDIAAPGENILSTIPGYYAYMSGTSMAAPHVTGVSSLAMGISDDLSPEQFIELIKQTGRTVPGSAKTSSGKMIDAEKLIENINPINLKVEEVFDSSLYIKGTTEAKAKITVKDSNNKLIGSGSADKNGEFKVKLKERQKTNSRLSIFSTVAKKGSDTIVVVSHDNIRPELKEALTVTNTSSTIEGIVSEESTINVITSTKQFKGKTDANGKFKITVGKQLVGSKGSIEISDHATPSNTLVLDFVVKDGLAPTIKKVDTIYDTSLYIEGEVSEKARIEFFTSNDNKNWTLINKEPVLTTQNNRFSYELEKPLTKGTKIKVTAVDDDANYSKETVTTVLQDKKPPLLVEPKTLSLNDASENEIVGKLNEKGTVEVKIGNETIVDITETEKNGIFKINIPMQKSNTKVNFIFRDSIGNKLEKVVTVSDGTKPVFLDDNLPKIYNTSKLIQGKVSEKSKVVAKVKGKIIGTTITDNDGNFTIKLKQLLNIGTDIELQATDYAKPKGLDSDVLNISVEHDNTFPVLLESDAADNLTSVSGKVSKEATVELMIGERLLTKKPIATDINGNFKISIAKQLAGTKISLLIKDLGANQIVEEVVVQDRTIPLIKKVDNFYYQTSSAISGIINESSTVSIYNVNANKPFGIPIASGVSDDNGNFKIEIDEQPINTKLAIVAVDSSGNISKHKIITVIKDRTAPTLKMEDIYTDNQEINGTLSEEGYVVVKIGSMSFNTVTDHTNSFKVILDEYLAARTRINVTVEDIVGNKRSYNYTVKK
ncbi:S8 family serine peptidase [uncultured Psychrobacillus sp.]|uniref:S8 family serine peptidase n=1 Tax=uncultured Psychrobacillus sp. TaxID=1551585 RepID=UPI002630B3BF|nr:S8 family serine peptidase [uncultured Psychrobacillus sp.]